MPRQPVEQSESAEVGTVEGLMGEGEGVNFGDGESPVTPPAPSEPPAPVERTAAGEEVKNGVVQRVKGERPPIRSEMTPAERAAMEASQVAPQRAIVPEDLEEIPGLPFLTVMKDALIGLVAKHGWEAVGEENGPTLIQNLPRLYRTLRFIHKGGIYGDRQHRGMRPDQMRGLIG